MGRHGREKGGGGQSLDLPEPINVHEIAGIPDKYKARPSDVREDYEHEYSAAHVRFVRTGGRSWEFMKNISPSRLLQDIRNKAKGANHTMVAAIYHGLSGDGFYTLDEKLSHITTQKKSEVNYRTLLVE